MSFAMPSAAQIMKAVHSSRLFFHGKGELKAVNGATLTLDGATVFAIGSVSKTWELVSCDGC